MNETAILLSLDEQIRRLNAENAKLRDELDTAKKYAEAYFDESAELRKERDDLLNANKALHEFLFNRDQENAKLTALISKS